MPFVPPDVNIMNPCPYLGITDGRLESITF